MQLPDTVSRAIYQHKLYHNHMLKNIRTLVSISDSKYTELQQATERELSELLSVILDGWPNNRANVPRQAQPYWDSRDELTVANSIILKGNRLTIPPSLWKHMTKLIHESHLGW